MKDRTSLVNFLREKLKMPAESDRHDVSSIQVRDDAYNNVLVEIGEFILSDTQLAVFFEAKNLRLLDSFFIVPRLERESDARHLIQCY